MEVRRFAQRHQLSVIAFNISKQPCETKYVSAMLFTPGVSSSCGICVGFPKSNTRRKKRKTVVSAINRLVMPSIQWGRAGRRGG